MIKSVIISTIIFFNLFSIGVEAATTAPDANYIDPDQPTWNTGAGNNGSITPESNAPTTFTMTNAPQVGRFNTLQDIGRWVISFILRGLVPFMIGLTLLTFLYGVLKFIAAGSNEEEHSEGRKFMLWGIIALFVMVSVWGLVSILTNTLGESIAIPTLNRLR